MYPPTSTRNQPMSLGELLNEGARVYLDNAGLFIGIALVLQIPEAILAMIISGLSSSGHGVAALILSVVHWVVGLIFSAAITGALARAISARYLGRPMTLSGAYDLGEGTLTRLVLGSLAYGVLVGIGFILFIIPGIYLAVRFAFVPQVIVLEGASIGQAFDRSTELVRGSWWRVFGILLTVILIAGLAEGLISGIISGALLGGNAVVNSGISALVGVFFLPFTAACTVLLYYDLRIRKEGFQIDHLAPRLGF